MLSKKFYPKDRMSRAMQKQKLVSLKLKGDKDADEFGTVILSLEIEY